MPYIGNNLATQFQAFATQTITGDGSTSYTLDRAVANGKELLVYINNVKQEEGSGKSYEASGTTITFSEAVASGDSCYLVYMGSAQQTVTAPDGSIVSGQIANATLALPSGLTVVGDTGIGTTSHSQKLHVSASNPFLELQGTASTSGDTGIFLNANANHWILKADNYSSTNAFQIKQGDTSSSTAFMTIDANGHITKPLQPAFLVRKGSDSNNISTGTGVSVVFDTETFDQNGDFNNSTGVFTAPVTGRYQLNVHVYVQQIPVDTSYFYIQLNTSNNAILDIIDPAAYDQEMTYYTFSINILADMDASDTASVIVYQQGGTQQVDIDGSNEINTSFSGFLAC